MEKTPARPSRSYGSFDISGSASVIAGDSQCTKVIIENSTLNLFCKNCCRENTTTHLEGRHCEAVLAIPFRSSNNRNGGHVNRDVPGPARQHHSYWRSDTSLEDSYHDTEYRKRVKPTFSGLCNDAGSVTVDGMGQEDVTTFTAKPNLELAADRKHSAGTQVNRQSLVVKDRPANSNILSGNKSNDGYRCQALSTGMRITFEECVSITFQDDLTKPCTFARDENQQRVFFLRTTGPGWSEATCAEIYMPGSEVDNRIKHGSTNRRRKKPRLEWVLRDLGVQGQRLLNHMVREVNRCDPSDFKWYVAAVDNEYPAHTRETGEVTAFMVVLARHLPQYV